MGYCHTLEVELRFERIEKFNFTSVLPKFKEKGVVTILCRNSQVFPLAHNSTPSISPNHK